MQQAATQEEKIDLAGMVADLNGLLRLKTTVIGMKMFAPDGGSHHRPDRQHGLAARLDRRHHRR